MISKDQTIHKTTDYTIFSQDDYQREISERHVKKLMIAIKENNRLHLHPLIVCRHERSLIKFKVVDGAHRLRAAKNLTLPIYYVIDEKPLPSSIITDQVQKSWGLPDYMFHYIKLGSKDYLKFSLLNVKFHNQFSSLFSLLGPSKIKNAEKFKKGTLSIPNCIENFVYETQDARDEIKKDKMRTLYSRDFIRAWFFIYITFPHAFNALLPILPQIFHKVPVKSEKITYEKWFIREYNHRFAEGKKHPKIFHPSDVQLEKDEDLI